MQPTLIAIKSDNKTVIYSIKGEAGTAILEANIVEFAGNKYYSHRGINYQLPKQFQGKRPVLR